MWTLAGPRARPVVTDGRAADVPADGFFLGVSLLDDVRPT
jgi:hypothetical protein